MRTCHGSWRAEKSCGRGGGREGRDGGREEGDRERERGSGSDALRGNVGGREREGAKELESCIHY